MGGVVARALFTLPRFNANLVSLIITQASPHLAPVLVLDSYLLGESGCPAAQFDPFVQNKQIFSFFFLFVVVCADFYSAVRQKWVGHASKLRNVTVLSVGGGYRDYQVRSGLTSLACPPGDPNKLSLVVRFDPEFRNVGPELKCSKWDILKEKFSSCCLFCNKFVFSFLPRSLPFPGRGCPLITCPSSGKVRLHSFLFLEPFLNITLFIYASLCFRCKELVLATVRAFFDLLDPETRQV